MKNFWFKIVLIGVVVFGVFMLFGCGSKDKNQSNNNKMDKENSIKPEEKKFISIYYNDEVSKDEKYLSKFYSNPQSSNISYIKKKLNDFGITKMSLIDLYNVNSKSRLKVMVSAFNVYFKGINKPRPDIEIITLINKNNSWYFLNDESVLNADEKKWLDSKREKERKFIVTSSNIQNIFKLNNSFDIENRNYMKNCQQKFLSDAN
ncbi:hypothetical protein [Clostridium felsineum]|uniref:hypothetical protein n=1 Tax=Clostridium felsineum TaxID=36839 RepID=UPI00098C83EA|nr:hypothetical protein [Clostridium felsineum]URZ02130.1 hypothetical protein CLAUR_021270 [Clostridium felsineum]URZ17963.1 hypothetical protein CLFE_040180 [Clostridium felsineum DSM 794]